MPSYITSLMTLLMTSLFSSSRGFTSRAVHNSTALCRSLRCALVMCAATVIVFGSIPLLSGCEHPAGGLVKIVGSECAKIFKDLMDAPIYRLPAGCAHIGTRLWEKNGRSTKFCFYADPQNDQILYIQFECEGAYYPMTMRRVFDPSPITAADGTTISSYDCALHFFRQTTVRSDAQGTRGMGQFVCPDDRVLASIAGYKDLTLEVNGRFVKSELEVAVEAGSMVTIEGLIDEVAHYAMSIGVEELTFMDGGDSYEVFLDRDVSALMMFRNDTFVECRFLFAPTQ